MNVFNINFPSDFGAIQQSYLSGSNTAEKIAVVLQVYRDAKKRFDTTPVQENIKRICEQYVNAAGIRLICVEHADTQVLPPAEDLSFQDLVENTNVSAAVQKIIVDHPGIVEAWGVDDLDLINRSYKAMNRLNESKQRQVIFFNRLCGFLYKAQVKYYVPELAQLRRNSIILYREGDDPADLSLSARASLINQIAEKINIDLKQFPVYHAFSTSMSQENSIDFERVKAQREKFIAKVTQRALSWVEAVKTGHLEIDKEMSQMVISLWMDNIRLGTQEFQYNLKLRGLENILMEAADWLETWLFESAIKIRLTGRGIANQSEVDYYDKLVQLDKEHKTISGNLRDFHNYMIYRQGVEQNITPIALMSELRECEKALIEGFDAQEVNQLSIIEDKLNIIYNALQVEQNPLDAEIGEVAPRQLVKLVTDLFELIGQNKIPKDIRGDLEFFDQLLRDAAEFPRLSRKRGQIMIRHTLELLRSRRDDRALLVVGGFHQRAVIQELGKNRQVSWELIIPKIDMTANKK